MPSRLTELSPGQLCKGLQVDLLSPAQRRRCAVDKVLQAHEAPARHKHRRRWRRRQGGQEGQPRGQRGQPAM